MTRRLKIIVDRPACCGYAICADICPEVYKLDENSIVYLDDDLAPEGTEAKAQEGCDACPQNAIKTEWVDA